MFTFPGTTSTTVVQCIIAQYGSLITQLVVWSIVAADTPWLFHNTEHAIYSVFHMLEARNWVFCIFQVWVILKVQLYGSWIPMCYAVLANLWLSMNVGPHACGCDCCIFHGCLMHMWRTYFVVASSLSYLSIDYWSLVYMLKCSLILSLPIFSEIPSQYVQWLAKNNIPLHCI